MASFNRLSYYSAMSEDDASDLEEGRECSGEAQAGDERTPLDRTIDRIGMGASCRLANCLYFTDVDRARVLLHPVFPPTGRDTPRT